jgi:hypothetical protein
VGTTIQLRSVELNPPDVERSQRRIFNEHLTTWNPSWTELFVCERRDVNLTVRLNLNSFLVVVNSVSVKDHRAATAFQFVATTRLAAGNHSDFDVASQSVDRLGFTTRQIPLSA